MLCCCLFQHINARRIQYWPQLLQCTKFSCLEMSRLPKPWTWQIFLKAFSDCSHQGQLKELLFAGFLPVARILGHWYRQEPSPSFTIPRPWVLVSVLGQNGREKPTSVNRWGKGGGCISRCFRISNAPCCSDPHSTFINSSPFWHTQFRKLCHSHGCSAWWNIHNILPGPKKLWCWTQSSGA